MAVGEFELVGNNVHSRYEINEGVNKANNSLLQNEASPPTQIMEQDGTNYNPDRIPESVFATNANVNPTEWSEASSDSLFSIYPGTMSVREDEMGQLEEPNKPNGSTSLPLPTFLEPNQENNILRTNEVLQENTKQCGGNNNSSNANKNLPNLSHRSNASSSSSLSFAFPILVPELQQGGAKKGDRNGPQRNGSLSRDEAHLDTENSISRPTPPPSSRKKRICCFFSCRSMFSCSSCRPRH